MPFASTNANLPETGILNAPIPPVKSKMTPIQTEEQPSFKEASSQVSGQREEEMSSTELLGENVAFAPPPIKRVLGPNPNAGTELSRYFLQPRRDSINPYCDSCIHIVNSITDEAEKSDEVQDTYIHITSIL